MTRIDENPSTSKQDLGSIRAPGKKPVGQLDTKNWAIEVYRGSGTQKEKQDEEEILEFDLEEEEADIA
jgi:hypothetical protein